jgi:hypothetical protein
VIDGVAAVSTTDGAKPQSNIAHQSAPCTVKGATQRRSGSDAARANRTAAAQQHPLARAPASAAHARRFCGLPIEPVVGSVKDKSRSGRGSCDGGRCSIDCCSSVHRWGKGREARVDVVWWRVRLIRIRIRDLSCADARHAIDGEVPSAVRQAL